MKWVWLLIFLVSIQTVQAAELTIVSPVGPLGDETVAGTRIPITIVTTDWTWASLNKNLANHANEGHALVFVDGVFDQMIDREGTFWISKPYGEHTVRIELVNNDHTALDPKILAEVTFNSTPNIITRIPEVGIESPSIGKPHSLIQGREVPITIIAANWNWIPSGSHTSLLPNSGHAHMFVDGKFTSIVDQEGTSLLHLSPDQHTITVDLRNTDHSPLVPSVNASVTISVVGGLEAEMADGLIIFLLLVVIVLVFWKGRKKRITHPTPATKPDFQPK